MLKDGDSLSFAFDSAGYTIYKLASADAYASCDFEGAELLATGTEDVLAFTEVVVSEEKKNTVNHYSPTVRHKCARGH